VQGSLAQHSSLFGRVCFTAALGGNAIFFLYANLHVGATEHVLLSIGGESVPMPGIFDFTLVGSVEQMWQSHSYPLSIIVALMSGVWTYAKLALVGALFWAPPSWISVRRRGLWLRVLDATGKWCLVDTQMLVIMMVALHFDIVVPSSDAGAPPLVQAQVETTPLVGVDAFLLATLSSIVVTHVALYLHRTAVRAAERERTRGYARELAGAALGMLDATSPPRTPGTAGSSAAPTGATNGVGAPPLLKPTNSLTPLPVGGVVRVHATLFASLGPCSGVPGLGGNLGDSAAVGAPHLEPLGEQLPLRVRLLVPLGLAASVPLMLVGMVVVSFTLHVHGIVGAILGADADTSYSMASLCAAIGGISALAPPFVLVVFQLVLFLTALVAPLVWPILLLVSWYLPLRPRALRRLLVIAETLYAWAMLDVFVVIVAAALLELDQVAKFTLGHECDGINAALQMAPELGALLPGEASCFGVAPTLDRGYWILVVGVILSTLCGGYATIAAHVALAEHVARARLAAGQ